MTISEALRELETCDWLKISAHHVSASRWKARAERLMLAQKAWAAGEDPGVSSRFTMLM